MRGRKNFACAASVRFRISRAVVVVSIVGVSAERRTRGGPNVCGIVN